MTSLRALDSAKGEDGEAQVTLTLDEGWLQRRFFELLNENSPLKQDLAHSASGPAIFFPRN